VVGSKGEWTATPVLIDFTQELGLPEGGVRTAMLCEYYRRVNPGLLYANKVGDFAIFVLHRTFLYNTRKLSK
jgi:DNA-binding transcriptional regulator PaaX